MSLWDDNSVQFPRLICEIEATHDLDIDALAESMSLEPADVCHLLNRALVAFEEIKQGLGK